MKYILGFALIAIITLFLSILYLPIGIMTFEFKKLWICLDTVSEGVIKCFIDK